MGYFSRQEFVTGLKLLNATSLDKLRKVGISSDRPLASHSILYASHMLWAHLLLRWCPLMGFTKGWSADRAAVMQVLPKLDQDVDEDEDAFSAFFAFAFKFCLMVRACPEKMCDRHGRGMARFAGSLCGSSKHAHPILPADAPQDG